MRFGALLLGLTDLAFSAPDVSMLTPGFSVRELPVKLTNINNLRFTPEGRLSALGYDGRVHILSDSDGDGLEDTDTLYWDKTTLSVPVGMAWSKDGLFVSSHGKISLLRDTDGDGKADIEDVIASGWPPTDVASGGVDATAITLDAAGNLYFGLLTANYANPYRVKDGVSRYDLKSPRGTIQKWTAASRQLETIATGIRVPYTLAFNRLGDLFVTDQEGATWCPDGNPLDELNHIQLGANYGFPPRHEKYLPDLISEPPVIGFGPQHQSTCGFVFNEPTAAQGRFGPASWENDVFVAGESRGKIWRARLVKTAAGYIGRETTIARLGLLTMDLAISPSGDLYVACHTGTPDWGTGPKGQGKLFKISYTDAAAPQPVAIWPSAPMEVNVAFDRPIDAAVVAQVNAAVIEFGDYVSAADRFEVLKPPYKVVKGQEATSRGKLRVVGARLSADARTVVLTTDPHPQSVSYSLQLPGIVAANTGAGPATIDLAYTLHGVEAAWTSADRTTTWKGWLPHLDSDVNAAFTQLSAEHTRLAGMLRQPGHLRLRTQPMLPGVNTRLRVTSTRPFTLERTHEKITARAAGADEFVTDVTLVSGTPAEALTFDIETEGPVAPRLTATFSSATDPTVRPVPLNGWLLPWATPHQPAPLLENVTTDLAGGDYERGRALFFGKQLVCATCHRMRGEGGTIGPDLSNLAHRDAASVLRDIQDPNAMINPDYVAYIVTLRSGTSLTGFVRAQDTDSLRIAGIDGKDQIVPRADISDLRPSPVSLMPPGLLATLKDEQVRDLLTFLVSAPATRSATEVAAVLRTTVPADSLDGALPPKPLLVVLAASKQDHGAGQHDYPAWQKTWAAVLRGAPGVMVATAWDWPSAEQWRTADAIVFYFRNKVWKDEQYREMDAFQQRGGGLVILHAATIADREPEKLALRIGLAAQPVQSKYRHMPLTLKFTAPATDPITRGFKPASLLDEPYWPMFGDLERIHVLATAEVDGAARPLVWTFQNGAGRVFGSIPGHYTWTLDDPLFRILILRGIAWACGEPTTRLENLR